MDKYTLYVNADIDPEVVEDFRGLLAQATGQKWLVNGSTKAPNQGILLELTNKIPFKTKESFRLKSNGTDFLIISSSSGEGLIYGLYKHLRQLGYRFYLPDENYTISPKATNPFGQKREILDGPFLQIRDFFGTGGFGSSNSDPGKLVEKDWKRWKLRNGFGAAYPLAGHRGENFIAENRDILKKNPQWLVSPLTQNPTADMTIKLNYLNKDALNYYVDWSLKPFTSPSFNTPPPGHTEFLSMEPSDGGGYLNELPQAGSRPLPSISDQVYSAANLAAQKLERMFPNNPNIGVNLYAYSSHAAPPSFKLHNRVFVQLIPYQFQNIAFGPSFVKLWASKLKRFGLYDYYNYPDAQFDLPGGMTLNEAMKRLTNSVRQGSEGTTYETSYSKFATGIPMWILGRYLTDGDDHWEKSLESLCTALYGTTASKIFTLFQLFYNEPFYGQQHLGKSIAILNEGLALSKDPAVHQRLNELKQYLQYVNLVYQSRDVSTGSLAERLLPVAAYAWKLYPSKIIHSYRIMQLVSYAFLNIDKNDKEYSLYQKLHADWFPETEWNKAAWSKIPQSVTASQTEKDFQAIRKIYRNTILPLQFKFSAVIPSLSGAFRPKQTMVFGGSDAVRSYFGIYAEKPATLTIRYKIEGVKPMLTISSIDQNYTADTAIVLTAKAGTLQIKVSPGETTLFFNSANESTYRIQADISNGYYFFDGSPRGKMAFYSNFNDAYEKYTYDPSFYPSHFYVPEDVTTVDYKVQLNALAISSQAGRKIQSEILSTEHGGFENRRFKVQQNEQGKIWKAEVSGNYNYNFLNIPDRYLLLEKIK
jgi:hypothetical protein